MTGEGIRVLVVDDEEPLRRLMQNELTRKGYAVETADRGAAALALLAERTFDVMLLDIVMPGLGGIEVLERMAGLDARPAVIVLTGQATVDTAVRAMRAGAFEYLSKPYRTDELIILINRAHEYARLQRENRLLQGELRRVAGEPRLVGDSPAFRRTRALIEKIAPTDASVLILGESGTGKEVVAAAIWRASRRRDAPFVPLNCASVSEGLLESELFGHEKGAFTGAHQLKHGLVEAADRGTLFLDEIGDMPLALQAKLLRFLDSGEFRRVGSNRALRVDVRVLAATNRDLAAALRSGSFREDLFYRLNVCAIPLAPLRERREDIPALAGHFLGASARALEKRARRFTPEAAAALAAYRWPGNVRELENIVERAVILAEGDTISAADLALLPPPAAPPAAPAPPAQTLEEVERRHIARVLEETGGNQKRASEILGIDRKTLYLKLKRYIHEDGA